MADINQWRTGEVISASRLNEMVDAINNLMKQQVPGLDTSNLVTTEQLTSILRSYSDVGHTHHIREIVDLVLPTVPTKLSQLQNDSDYATITQVNQAIDNAQLDGSQVDLTSYAKKTDLPTKTSQLTNDSNFISSIPSEYVTETKLNEKGYLTEIPSEYVTETELEDKGYLTEHQDLSNYALKTEIPSVPTKTSQLTNDNGYLTSVPSEYITETELNEKGYLTEHQDISNKADKTEIPTNVSQLTNDVGYITSIPSEYITEEELESKGYLTSIPNEYVTETELESKGYLTEHQDISGKADKSYVDTELAKKSDKTHTHSYNDLSDKPVIPSIDGLATKKELTDGLATKSDTGHTHDQYLTKHQDISGKANKSDIPTKTSQLTNDSGFITEVPSEYITEIELNSKGLATETFVTNKIADSLILTSPNGSKFTITVSDDGQLSATPYGTNE